MLVFGADIPLIEVIFALAIIIFFLLVESVVVVMLMVKQLNKTKRMTELIQNLSNTLLQIKKAEIEELDKIRSINRK